MKTTSLKRKLAILSLPILLGGCAATAEEAFYSNPFAGFSAVQANVQSATGKRSVWLQNKQTADAIAAQVHDLVHQKTIDADTAVQVALLNNKSLQAAYADLGLSATAVWQEATFENPTASVGVLAITAPEVEAFRAIEGTIVNGIFSLLTRERRIDIAETDFRRAQFDAALATLSLAAETRRAWIEAASAWERVVYLDQAKAAADAASELAESLGKSGALPKAAQAREHVFYAELAGETAQARLAARLAKEELTRLMGLWGENIEYEVPNRLPALPNGLVQKDSIVADALRHRADLQAAMIELEAIPKRYGLEEATRYVTDLALMASFEAERGEDGEAETAANAEAEVEFVIPIFDSGKASKRAAELEYMRAANLLAQQAVTVRSEACAAYDAYRSTYDIARHYQNAVLPLRTTIQEEALLTYNGMITSTFELLADTRATIDSRLLFIDAKREFWLAQANLAPTIYGGGGEAGGSGGEPAEIAEAAEAGH